MGTALLDIDGACVRDMFHLSANAEVQSPGSPGCPAGDYRIQVMVSSPDISDEAHRVVAIYRSQHGVSFFDSWEVVEALPASDIEAMKDIS